MTTGALVRVARVGRRDAQPAVVVRLGGPGGCDAVGCDRAPAAHLVWRQQQKMLRMDMVCACHLWRVRGLIADRQCAGLVFPIGACPPLPRIHALLQAEINRRFAAQQAQMRQPFASWGGTGFTGPTFRFTFG